MIDRLLQIIGTGLVALALIDIYLTVLSPRLGSSLISLPLMRKTWWLFRRVSRMLPVQRERFLFHAGSTMLILVIFVWLVLLVIGFALIVWTALGTGIRETDGGTSVNFWTAVYYSGFSLTTLGTGDLAPETNWQRLLMLVQSALGFSIFTLTITYLLSVYNALIRRNTFALSLHHRSNSTADAAEMLARLTAGGKVDGLQQDISNIARDLMNLLESQHSYSILLFFRFEKSYYAFPRMLLMSIETATLLKSALNDKHYCSLVNSAAVTELWGGSLQMLDELSRIILSKDQCKQNHVDKRQWRERYYEAVDRLKAENVKPVADLETGADRYVELREKWHPQLVELANYMGYQWHEIAPHET